MLTKTLNVCVIGLSMGLQHVQGIKAVSESHFTLDADGHKIPAFAVYSICDINQHLAEEVGREYGIPHVYTDYKDMIADPALDVVLIVTPDQLHREMVENSLAAGKHVLCEKPLAITREDCEAIAAAVEKSDRKFMVGQICRYTPGFRQAKEIIDSGAIGELTFVESEYANDYSKISSTWRKDPNRNGVVGGGCHAVDLLRWIAGNPEEVVAYGTHKTFKDLTPYADTHVAVLKFPNEVIGKVFVSVSCKRNYTMRSVFYGTKGTIIVDNTSPTMTVFKEDLFPGMNKETMPITVPVDVNNHNTAGEFLEFYDIIANDKPVQTTVYEGANTVATCMAIYESAATGKPVKPKLFK